MDNPKFTFNITARPHQKFYVNWAKKKAFDKYQRELVEQAFKNDYCAFQNNTFHIRFTLPVPITRSKKINEEHFSKPGKDELIIGFLEALEMFHGTIQNVSASKVWGEFGKIEIFGIE